MGSGCFRQQRSVFWIQSSANFYIEHLFTVNCKENTRINKKRLGMANIQNWKWGSCHSSVVSSVPTILQPWVRIPSAPSTLFQFVKKIWNYNSYWNEKRSKIHEKDARVGENIYFGKNGPIFGLLSVFSSNNTNLRKLNVKLSPYFKVALDSNSQPLSYLWCEKFWYSPFFSKNVIKKVLKFR